MARLPAPLQPAFPLVKRAHRLATRGTGALTRRTTSWAGGRAVPSRATETAEETAALEADSATFHAGGSAEHLHRAMPAGDPSDHWFFREQLDAEIPRRFTLELAGGTVVGDYAAHLTRGGVLDHETSPYFGTDGWREHPLFLRARLPEPQHVPGTLLSLATRGSWGNYYHFVMDALPRLGILRESMPDAVPDVLFVNTVTRYQRELLTVLGLDVVPTVEAAKHAAYRADRLLVPSIPNNHTIGPRWTTQWLRANLANHHVRDKPRRLFVTRERRRNSRRLVNEDEVMLVLEPLGFVRLDPGSLSVRDQIDHFAAAELIVGVHGAALTNLNFVPEGARLLELFAPKYLNPGYWSILDNVEGTRYRYLLGEGPCARAGTPMLGLMNDITVDITKLRRSLDELAGDVL
jgi:capsular polysaccharide biosynthesis protein